MKKISRKKSLSPLQPNIGIKNTYYRNIMNLIRKMQDEAILVLKKNYKPLKSPYKEGAQDVRTSYGSIDNELKKLLSQWIKDFQKHAPSIAHNFAYQAEANTSRMLQKKLREAGFTVSFQASEKIRKLMRQAVQENVALINSIPEKYFGQIAGAVYKSAANGRDLKTLTDEIKKIDGVTHARAAFIARDQNNKITSMIERARCGEVGIKEAIWVHSAVSQENSPRPSHAKAGRDKLRFNIDKGAYLDGEWVHPGMLINCRCRMRPIIPAIDEKAYDSDFREEDHPRDEDGKFTSSGGAISDHHALQEKYKDLIDRLSKEYADLKPYDANGWNMGKGGYDTRKEGGLSRPIVLGEISHPQDPSKKVPIIFHEGEQDTSIYNGWGYGRRHIEFRHGQEIRDKGFKDALDFVSHLIHKYNFDEEDYKHGSRILAITPETYKKRVSANMVALKIVENGDHYSVNCKAVILVEVFRL